MTENRATGIFVGLRRRPPLGVMLAGLLFLAGASSIGPSGCEPIRGSYLGTEVCLACHDGRVASDHTSFRASMHNTVECEECHGPGLQHVHDGGPNGLYIDVPPTTFTGLSDFCAKCHAPEAADYAKGAHAESNVTCLDCHDVHAAGEVRTSAKNNRLCLQCHKREFNSTEAIADHTWHSVDPAGIGTSRCTTCHMPPTQRIDQNLGQHRHSLIPLAPITSNDAAQAGVTPVPPNSCSGIVGCHDGPNIYLPHFDVDNPIHNTLLQAIFEYRYPQAGGL